MDDEPERMDPRCDAGGRGYMLWMGYCNDGEYIRATDYDALAAKLAEWQAAQHYTYIGKDGKPVLARDLEARAEAAEARIAHLENHIEGVAKDTHKIMVDLATPLDDPRVKALVGLLQRAQDIIDPCYPAKHAVWQNDTRATLEALETEQ